MITLPIDALVSYHYSRKAKTMMPSLTSDSTFRLIADSGAFSAFTQGATIDLGEYAEWLHEWRHTLAWAASLDVFGDPVASFANWKRLRDVHGLVTVPTVHIGTDLTWLDAYAGEGVDFVGLGGMVGRPAKAQLRFVVHAVRHARDHHPAMRFHTWGTTTIPILSQVPVYSCDSSGLIGQAFRFAKLQLWHPRERRTVEIALDGRTPYRHQRLLLDHYGVHPSQILTSHLGTRSLLMTLGLRSVQTRATTFRALHQVAPPASLWQAGEPGPRLHIADTDHSNLVRIRAAVQQLNQQKEGTTA